jgi:hypothetical protein
MKVDLTALACVIVLACLVIMTIALGHLAWGW